MEMLATFMARGKFLLEMKGQNPTLFLILLVHADTLIYPEHACTPAAEWEGLLSPHTMKHHRNNSQNQGAGKYPRLPAWNFPPDLGPTQVDLPRGASGCEHNWRDLGPSRLTLLPTLLGESGEVTFLGTMASGLTLKRVHKRHLLHFP